MTPFDHVFFVAAICVALVLAACQLLRHLGVRIVVGPEAGRIRRARAARIAETLLDPALDGAPTTRRSVNARAKALRARADLDTLAALDEARWERQLADTSIPVIAGLFAAESDGGAR